MHDSSLTRFDKGFSTLMFGVQIGLRGLPGMSGYNALRQLRDVSESFTWGDAHEEYHDDDDGGTQVDYIEFDLYAAELQQLEIALNLLKIVDKVTLTVLTSVLSDHPRRARNDQRVQYQVVKKA